MAGVNGFVALRYYAVRGKFVNIHTVSFVDNVRVPLNDPK